MFRCWKYVSIVRFSACKNVSKCKFYRTTFYVKCIRIIIRSRWWLVLRHYLWFMGIKKKEWADLYHCSLAVNTHCQHTFQQVHFCTFSRYSFKMYSLALPRKLNKKYCWLILHKFWSNQMLSTTRLSLPPILSLPPCCTWQQAAHWNYSWLWCNFSLLSYFPFSTGNT